MRIQSSGWALGASLKVSTRCCIVQYVSALLKVTNAFSFTRSPEVLIKNSLWRMINAWHSLNSFYLLNLWCGPCHHSLLEKSLNSLSADTIQPHLRCNYQRLGKVQIQATKPSLTLTLAGSSRPEAQCWRKLNKRLIIVHTITHSKPVVIALY